MTISSKNYFFGFLGIIFGITLILLAYCFLENLLEFSGYLLFFGTTLQIIQAFMADNLRALMIHTIAALLGAVTGFLLLGFLAKEIFTFAFVILIIVFMKNFGKLSWTLYFQRQLTRGFFLVNLILFLVAALLSFFLLPHPAIGVLCFILGIKFISLGGANFRTAVPLRAR